MLKVEQVSKSFAGHAVLKNVSFSLSEGEMVGLCGPSGSGKSVLLKLLGHVDTPDSGRIFHEGREDGLTSTTVGFLFQEGALFDSLSVIDNVAFPLLSAAPYRSHEAGTLSRGEAMAQAYEILSEVGLSAAYRKYPGQLSGGMRRRVALARALVEHPEVVLLDDPTGGLDPVAASVIMNLIGELHAHYRSTVVMVSHDIRRLLPNVSRLLALFEGRLDCDLPVEALQSEASAHVLRFLSTRYDFPGNEASP